MGDASITAPRTAADGTSTRKDAVILLQLFALAAMVIPSDTILKPLGAIGYPASLFGIFVFTLFAVSVLLGFHNPARHSHPIQGLLCVVWISLLASYILMDRGRLTGPELANADRVLIKFMVFTGVALVASEWLRSVPDAMRVVRVLCWGGAVCGVIAALQYWLGLDLARFLRMLPGFTVNHDNPGIVSRGALNRVAGTAITPIELGVVAGMLIPLAVCLGLYEREKSAFKRWGPLVMIGFSVATSVSRSAILSVFVAFVVLVILMPPVPRLVAFCMLPVAVGGVFMSAHGLIGTILAFFQGASSDSSIAYRTHDYPLAEAVWQQAPWFGHGPGSWLPASDINIFDNQYLDAAVELGMIGVLALLLLLLFPAVVAVAARRATADPDLRMLCTALAAAGFVTPLASLTFDSLAFPMFVNTYALVTGLTGACWRMAAAERARARSARRPASGLTPLDLPQSFGLQPRRAAR